MTVPSAPRPLDYQALKARRFPEVVQTWGPRDCILYALGVGAGMEPGDLAYTYERGLRVLPTQAVVLGYPGFWLRAPDAGLDWASVLHTHQELIIHRPLAVEGTIIGRTSIEEIHDRGARGALMITRRDIADAATGAALATVRVTELCRGQGGFGGPPPPAQARPVFPDRPADMVVTLPSSPQAALIYRLSGDDNALHVDPEVAAEVGFDQPILHGLSTFGMAGRAVLRAFCADAPERLRLLRVRFTSPVLPGETLRFELWRDGPGRGLFRAFAGSGRLVLDDGEAGFDPLPASGP